jgi:uncharacterized protein YdaU (DUF1376 family)
MAKDPAFLFYPGDFNTGTQFFSDEQVGKYMRMLMAQHQHGHLSDDQVKFICKSYDNQVMSKFKKDSAGLWFNERLEEEILKRRNFVNSRSKNKSGKTKEKITSKSYDLHMENGNRNEDGLNKGEVDFSDYEHWTEDVIKGNDWLFTDKLRNLNIHVNGQLSEYARSHLALLAQYPKKQPSDQNKFRISLIAHIEDKQKNGSGKQQTDKGTAHTAGLMESYKQHYGEQPGNGQI